MQLPVSPIVYLGNNPRDSHICKETTKLYNEAMFAWKYNREKGDNEKPKTPSCGQLYHNAMGAWKYNREKEGIQNIKTPEDLIWFIKENMKKLNIEYFTQFIILLKINFKNLNFLSKKTILTDLFWNNYMDIISNEEKNTTMKYFEHEYQEYDKIISIYKENWLLLNSVKIITEPFQWPYDFAEEPLI